MEKEKVLLMYSGGLDSILSMIRLIKEGYKVLLIHFDNGCSISIGSEVIRALEFEKRFGIENVEYVGKISTVPQFRNNEREVANIPFSEFCDTYGDATISQLRCLNCRSAMYYEAIKYCLNNEISYIAEGARKSQLFSIEQPIVIDTIKSLLDEFNITLLLPVYYLENDFLKEQELLLNGVLPSASEDKCILGMPLEEEVPTHQTEAINRVLEIIIKPRYLKNLKKDKTKQLIYKGKGNAEYF